MSVQSIMEAVNNCVLIAMGVIGALVSVDTHWMLTT